MPKQQTDFSAYTRRGRTVPVRCFVDDRDRITRLAGRMTAQTGQRWEGPQIIALALDTLEGVLQAFQDFAPPPPPE